MSHGLFYACGAFACHAFFGGFFYLGNFFIVQFREPWLGVWFRFFFLQNPLDGSFWMILVSLATARKAILPFDVFLA